MLVVAALCAATACAAPGGPDDSGPATLRWYVDDAGAYAALARTCSDASEGRYRFDLVQAPTDRAQRRVDLVRRLVTGDDLDLLGVDTALVGELATAGLLADLPADAAADLTDGRTDESVAAVTVDGQVVAAPWWYEPQVLLYRGSTAERAGLDMSEAVTWNALIGGAARLGGTVQVAGGPAEWVRGLVGGASSGDVATTVDGQVAALDGPAGASAADVVRTYAASEVGPGPSRAAATTFAAPGGTFLVGPVSLLRSPELAPVLAEVQVAPYPLTTTTSETSRAPLAGTALAVPASAGSTDVAMDAVACLTGAPAQEQLAAETGHVPTLASVLTSAEVAGLLQRPEVVTAALTDGVPEPVDATAHLLDLAVTSRWTPVDSVGDTTPPAAAAEARRLLDGGLT